MIRHYDVQTTIDIIVCIPEYETKLIVRIAKVRSRSPINGKIVARIQGMTIRR